ncbi:MAG TPA: hypothetical protein ENF78_00325 [Candidatus Bathyarchaeota archaeon]|nr:hypothetical protein [Candidatus Bathyarchaeota archaeon]
MELKLLASSPDVETIIATAMLTTCSREGPSELLRHLREKPKKVKKLVKALSLKHGSVIEHNRLIFLANAKDDEVLELLLASHFIEASRLGDGKWLLSCNLRTVVELLTGQHNLPPGVREGLLSALREVAPTFYEKVVGHEG